VLPKNREFKEILTFSQTSMLPKNREFLEFEDFFFLKNFSIHFKTYKITDLEKVNHQKALNGFYKRFLQASYHSTGNIFLIL